MSDADSDPENLSIKLFKPYKPAPETSGIVGALHQDLAGFHNPLDGDSEHAWYRVLRRIQWTWLGVEAVEQEAILARIAASTNERSNPKLIDTVIGYRPGNWSYEWVQTGMEHQRQAQAYDEKGNKELAAQHWQQALAYFTIGSYPHLKGDALSLQAELLANKTFNALVEHSPYAIKTIETKVDGKNLTGFLYLPHTEKPLPTVMVCGGLDTLQIQLWRLFNDYFAPANIAMFTLDMPSVGRSGHWAFGQDTSKLQQQMLNTLVALPWVDHEKIGCLGMRLGGNAAVRMAFVESQRIKSCVSIGGVLHSMLTEKQQIDRIPAMYLDTIASRMHKTPTHTFLAQLRALSLKEQGLLSGRRTPVPILALRLEEDPVCSDADNQLAAFYSQGGKALTLNGGGHQAFDQLFVQAIEWFKRTL